LGRFEAARFEMVLQRFPSVRGVAFADGSDAEVGTALYFIVIPVLSRDPASSSVIKGSGTPAQGRGDEPRIWWAEGMRRRFRVCGVGFWCTVQRALAGTI